MTAGLTMRDAVSLSPGGAVPTTPRRTEYPTQGGTAFFSGGME